MEAVHKISMMYGSRPRTRGYATMWVGWEVTVGVTIHDMISNLRQRGADGGKLRHKVKTRFGTICCQSHINEPNMGGNGRI